MADHGRKMKVCIYCSADGNLTDDHIPPKALFKKPRPGNMIAVPACAACNSFWSKDDEYFRSKVGLNDAGRGHPDVDANTASILRSLQKPEAKGMRKAFLNDLIEVERRTPSGLYAGQAPGATDDFSDRERKVCHWRSLWAASVLSIDL